MKPDSRTLSLFIVAFSGLFVLGTLIVAAQDTTQTQTNVTTICEPMLENFYTFASELCIGGPDGHVCNGGNPPNASPAGPVMNSLSPHGALVPVDAIDSLRTSAFAPDGSSGGLLWMRIAETRASALLIGEVSVENAPIPDFPKWQSVIVQTGETVAECAAAPRNAFVIQNDDRLQPLRMIINGASIDLNGTAMIQTHGNNTYFVTLDGQLRVIANGQTQGMVAGQQTQVTYNPGDFSTAMSQPSVPVPFDQSLVRNVPIPLFDRASLLPQPGYVATDGLVNMRTEPSLSAPILLQVPEGQIMTILGRNPAGDWFHVRLTTGQTGWMFAELLRRNHDEITAVYVETPVPPQRYGNLGTVARISAPAGVLLLSAPYVGFDALYSVPAGAEVNLLAKSPYNPWVKVDAGNGEVGWVALITVDTKAIISSLPTDYDIPLPPEPTLVPGSWGNAFPDLNCYPNC
jgi:uncharacterized protein YgiM (DUF1202 family)